ncbi:MAG: lytic transglycosylase domain-containing protein, partial [Rickettsiales bacterium]|nr:lytic transglycosylase domain-containing protein [Rickettsiales bacterium]
SYHEQDSLVIGAILSISHKESIPNLSIRLSKALKETDLNKYHSAAFPVPQYSLDDGWKMDKAFVYAIARQESLFNEAAKSNQGARGLLQIMPATAAYVTNDATLKKNKDLLYDPEYNLSIGQEYMKYLIEKEDKNPNLIRVLVSYNAGPGNHRKWESKIICYDDPLLYIESLPSKETRNYVKNVMLNFWFYRSRFNQDTPSLANLAQDQWPIYHSLDD